MVFSSFVGTGVTRSRDHTQCRKLREAGDHRLGHHVGSAVDRAEIMNDENIGMVERGSGARFVVEAAEANGIGRDVCRQELHGDVAIELRIARQVYLAHPAGADLRQYLIRTNTAAYQAPFRNGAVFDLLPLRRSHRLLLRRREVAVRTWIRAHRAIIRRRLSSRVVTDRANRGLSSGSTSLAADWN
jgi:hypothetical protein